MLRQLLYLIVFALIATVSAQAQINSVGIIGSATPGGWDADTEMTQDENNPDIWTISLELTTGASKFRTNNDWAVNWGGETFPTGTGTQDGPDIVTAGGVYDISLNTATGEYTFTYTGPSYGSVGIIGTGTPIGNFDEDVDMVQYDSIPWVYNLEITLTADEVKFRENDDWAVNWGSTDWPSGTGALGGDNIPVATPGDYNVTFNAYTGEYNFEALIPIYNTIGIIGTATPDGWDADTDLTQNPNNPSLWSANLTLTDGVAKFRAEDNWDVSWGAEDFPMGVAVLDGPDIPVTAGEYNVQFNSATGEYNFAPPIAIFNSIGVIGSATGLGFDEDIDMYQDAAEPDQWYITLSLTNGVIKFRANDDWATNWGDDGFPTGTGVQDGPDIPVFEGTWEIAFNATTGVYSMTPMSVGIIGTATPGGWDSDTDMQASSTVGSTWSLDIELLDGEAKFRRDDDWATNWGAEEFPAGTGTQDGANIPVTAGTYSVTLNSQTGDYAFNGSNSTLNLLDNSAVKVFPNPTSSSLNINIEAVELQKNVQMVITDLNGRVIRVQQLDVLENLNVDVSNLEAGMYILQLSNDNYLLGKRFTVVK
ncbi:MAG: SusF/SusE family outer membrane protein [Saprospiraceae bacterium]|nr:SusF/SusE family outer membrane protein [Saprospiraceae bacterium]